MRSLLDINFLIALLDPQHSFHDEAHIFWKAPTARVWASCPLVENGVLRILAGAAYPGRSSYSNEHVLNLLKTLIDNSDHEFWPDDISVLDQSRFDQRFILGPKQLTDIYLLGLATANDGRLVTFDRRVSPAAVFGASERNLLVIE